MTERLLHVEPWQDFRTGRAKDLGEVWMLTKGAREVRCVLQGHPLGVEARIVIDGDVYQTQVFKQAAQMVDVTAEWRAAYESKGWGRE